MRINNNYRKRKEYMKQYYIKNRDKILAKLELNKEERHAKQKIYRINNREKENLRAKHWRDNNKEHYLKREAKKREQNREKIREKAKIYRNNNREILRLQYKKYYYTKRKYTIKTMKTERVEKILDLLYNSRFGLNRLKTLLFTNDPKVLRAKVSKSSKSFRYYKKQKSIKVQK
jgi:hypothetical protein